MILAFLRVASALLLVAVCLARGVRAEPDVGERSSRQLEPRLGGSLPPDDWPAEPGAPGSVVPERFEEALAQLCPEPERGSALAAPILESASEFGVDPFLLAALVYQQSRCRERHAGAYGVGLTSIQLGMHRRHIYDRGHRRDPPIRYPFTPRALRAPRANLHLAAALLNAIERQCPTIDTRFRSVPHRHFVSHFVWGDQVRGTRSEDEILIARRRLIHYYAPYAAPPRKLAEGAGPIALSSPLDGAPRLVMGVIGDPRDGGRRIHLGIDLAADGGEPVRAMADGVVEFAGIDRHQVGLFPLTPAEAERARGEPMGPRGLFVRIVHGDGVETLYAHLARYGVRIGQSVRAGELIGQVGRTGMQASEAHLHLGVFVDDLPVDPWPLVRPYAVLGVRALESRAGAFRSVAR
jgi:Peptidase family M23